MAIKPNVETFVSLFSILALLSSLTSAIDLKQFIKRLKRPKGIIIGLICQYGILPVTAFGLWYLFNLNASIGMALVIIATCPGGASSNILCFIFNADLPLSIAMTTTSSVLSFVFITMNGAIYIPIISKNTKLNLDYIALLLSVGAVLIGIAIGVLVASIKNQTLIKFMGLLGATAGLLILIFSLLHISHSDARLRDCPPLAYAAIVCMNIIVMFVSFCSSLLLDLKPTSSVAVTFESSNQNAPLAITIILLSLNDSYERDLALNIPIIYMFNNFVLDVIFGVTLRMVGWLTMDMDDETMTLGKIIMQWKENRKNKACTSNNDDQNEMALQNVQSDHDDQMPLL